jgi:hypothetical protein
MINPDKEYTILKKLRQIPENLTNGTTHGIDLVDAGNAVEMIKNAIDYVDSFTEPSKFRFQIVDHAHDDLVYYTYSHVNNTWIEHK